MGFTVTEELDFSQYGVTVTGCYVTIKASYQHLKLGNQPIGMYLPPSIGQPQGPYSLISKFYVYTSNDTALSPLRESYIVINQEFASEDPIADIYSAIKAQYFAGKTFTDDL
jgi:hypothetical protein